MTYVDRPDNYMAGDSNTLFLSNGDWSMVTLASPEPIKHDCFWCHGKTFDDNRGHCCACGAPRNLDEAEKVISDKEKTSRLYGAHGGKSDDKLNDNEKISKVWNMHQELK